MVSQSLAAGPPRSAFGLAWSHLLSLLRSRCHGIADRFWVPRAAAIDRARIRPLSCFVYLFALAICCWLSAQRGGNGSITSAAGHLRSGIALCLARRLSAITAHSCTSVTRLTLNSCESLAESCLSWLPWKSALTARRARRGSPRGRRACRAAQRTPWSTKQQQVASGPRPGRPPWSRSLVPARSALLAPSAHAPAPAPATARTSAALARITPTGDVRRPAVPGTTSLTRCTAAKGTCR